MSGSNVVEGLNFPEQKKQYIIKTLDPILEEMVADVLSSLPESPVDFMIKWLEKRGGPECSTAGRSSMIAENAQMKDQLGKMGHTLAEAAATIEGGEKEDPESEEEEDDDDELDEMPEHFKKPEGQMKTARASVSAEAYGAWNQKKAFTAPVHPKSDEQKARLRGVLMKSFLFAALEGGKEMDTVIGAMLEVNCEAGKRLITQGEDGDYLFVIEEGTLECKIQPKDGGDEKVVKTCTAGDAFGELALLYNCPRAAHVDSTSKCVLWQLDRETFNHIVKDAAMKKREKYEAFLKGVPLLSSMDAYELSQISDALKVETFSKDDFIVKQGEPGNAFYILEDGTAIATKSVEGAEATKVMDYKAGDYFGELALLKGEPRAANIVAQSDVKVLTLDRVSFKKMLGPLQDILARTSYK